MIIQESRLKLIDEEKGTGKDELLVRVYTIRAVDVEQRELSIDFLHHPTQGVNTPGADFALHCVPGDRLALLGPSGGSLPLALHMLLVGDESALPAIARIIAEVPAGTDIQAIIEVQDAVEEQPLPTAGKLNLRWLHRIGYPDGAKGFLAEEAKAAIAAVGPDTLVWVACEKEERQVSAQLPQEPQAQQQVNVCRPVLGATQGIGHFGVGRPQHRVCGKTEEVTVQTVRFSLHENLAIPISRSSVHYGVKVVEAPRYRPVGRNEPF